MGTHETNGKTLTRYDPAKCIPVILDAIESGESLVQTCKDSDELPADSTFLGWVKDDPELAERYARAREIQAERLGDQIIYEADRDDIDPADKRIRVDTRKWWLSKVLPRFADKPSSIHVGDVNQTLTVETGPADMGKWLADIAGRLSGRNGSD